MIGAYQKNIILIIISCYRSHVLAAIQSAPSQLATTARSVLMSQRELRALLAYCLKDRRDNMTEERIAELEAQTQRTIDQHNVELERTNANDLQLQQLMQKPNWRQ